LECFSFSCSPAAPVSNKISTASQILAYAQQSDSKLFVKSLAGMFLLSVPPQPAAKGSKKKKTKAELEAEKLAAEEEARKAEDARLRREEDDR
jgi:hypothetical protein